VRFRIRLSDKTSIVMVSFEALRVVDRQWPLKLIAADAIKFAES
jgi:hypothetical protein